MSTFNKNKKNYNNKKCYIIAEAGLNHNGSLEIAKNLIDIAADAGVNAVKFQKRTIEELATKEILETEDNRFPSFGKTYGEIRRFIEFNFEQYQELKEYTKEKNLDFIVTPFDIPALHFLSKLGVDKYKLASHSLTNLNLLKEVASKSKDTILSTGMSSLDEIDTAISIFNEQKNLKNLSLLHCVSSYPTPIKDCNISMIQFYKSRYKIKTGYSGHELGYTPTLAAVALGAEIVERHFTISKKMEGFDHKLSLEPEELKNMVNEIRNIEKSLGNTIKNISETEVITRKKYHVSMITKMNIKKGEKLTKDKITYKNPGTGIPPKDEIKFLNKIFLQDVKEDTLISADMLNE